LFQDAVNSGTEKKIATISPFPMSITGFLFRLDRRLFLKTQAGIAFCFRKVTITSGTPAAIQLTQVVVATIAVVSCTPQEMIPYGSTQR
jgi:hypothetical protein